MVNKPTESHRFGGPTPGGSVPSTAESDLRTSVSDQAATFQSAVTLIERLETLVNRREIGTLDSVSQLQKSLDQVVSAQQKVAAAHARFVQSGVPLTGDLKSTLARHEELLKTLITRIDGLQHIFEGVRSELTPQLDVETRRRNMQTAYQQSLRTI